MKIYYYRLTDNSWDEMEWVLINEGADKYGGEMQPVDNHIRIPQDWRKIVMPIEVFKHNLNLILLPKVKDQKRINIWKSFYKDYHAQCNVNGFIRCLVEGETIIIESLDKYWEPCLRICI